MMTPEILAQIKELEMYTKRLVSGTLMGDSTSAQKGSGIDFDQIREYQQGDDVRFIDWKSTARTGELLVKQYIEERNRTVLLAVDISSSCFYGSGDHLKSFSMAQVASILALVAQYGKDHVGLILFSDTVHRYIPPAKGQHQSRLIMETLLTVVPEKRTTSIASALQYLAQLKKKDALVFIISDFIDTGFEKSLSLVSRMYDCIAIMYRDDFEMKFPSVGFITLEDLETGEHIVVDARKKGAKAVQQLLEQNMQEQSTIFSKYRVDCVTITHQKSSIATLMRFFKDRMKY